MEKIEIMKEDEKTIVVKYENNCYKFSKEKEIKVQKEKISDLIINNGTKTSCPEDNSLQLELKIIVNSKKEIVEIEDEEDENETENTIIYLLCIDSNNNHNNSSLILEILMSLFGITITKEQHQKNIETIEANLAENALEDKQEEKADRGLSL